MRCVTGLVGAVLGLTLAGLAPAQEPAGVQVADSMVAFDFQAADLRVVVSALADVAGLNIVYGDLPSRPVTLRTSQPVPLSEVRALLESVARANELQLVEDDGLIRVISLTPPEERAARPGAQRRRPGEPLQRRLFVHRLRHAPAPTIVQTLRALFGLDTGFGGEDDRIGRTLSEELRDQQVASFREMEAVPAGRAEAVRERGPGGVGQEGLDIGLEAPVDLVADPLRNAILVLATPADYEIISETIQQLDVRPLQVLIEVMIAEVRRNRQTDLGVNVNVPVDDDGEFETGFELRGASAGDVIVRFLGIGDVDASVVLSALAAQGDVTILSRPLILAQNNQEARILIGDQRPFIQVFRALPTDAAVRDQVVQYRNVGTQLSIRPTINEDGYVNLAVQQEVSVATAEIQFGAPVINTREAQTELLVRSGHTAVLGGLIDRQQDKNQSGIPLLKDIPVLGWLFRSTQVRTTTTELFLLLTPHVIETDEEMDETTRQLRESTEELKKRIPESTGLLRGLETPGDSIPSDRDRSSNDPPQTPRRRE